MNLPLTDHECEMLLSTLRDRLTNLKVEVHRAEAHAFRKKLEQSQRTLEGLVTKLEYLERSSGARRLA